MKNSTHMSETWRGLVSQLTCSTSTRAARVQRRIREQNFEPSSAPGVIPNRATEPNMFFSVHAEAVRAASNIRLLGSFDTLLGARQLRAWNTVPA